MQELLGPKHVEFCDNAWNVYGSRIHLAKSITATIGIDTSLLDGTHTPQHASVARRICWASNRATTKPEDTAYCLLGLFNVNTPPLYGEKWKAFTRLQYEIIKSSDDESIFARVSNNGSTGLLAKSSKAFEDGKQTVNIRLDPTERLPYFITNKGVQVRSASDTQAKDDLDRSTAQSMDYEDHVLELGCLKGSSGVLTTDHSHSREMWEQGALTKELQRFDPTWGRFKCDQLGRAINAGRSKCRNRSYSGKGVQRIYLVHA